MTLKQLRVEVLRLPVKARAALAKELLDSLDGPKVADTTEQWLDEAERRYAAYKAGRLPATSAEEALRFARAQLR